MQKATYGGLVPKLGVQFGTLFNGCTTTLWTMFCAVRVREVCGECAVRCSTCPVRGFETVLHSR